MPDTPPSRRSLRAHESSRGSKAEAKSPDRKPKKPLLRSARLWVPIVCGVIVLAIAVTGLWVGAKALKAKDELQAAIPLAHTVENSLLHTDKKGAEAAAQKMRSHTRKAREITDDTVWRSLEWVPIIGTNLHAVRVASETADDLTRDAVVPVSRINIDTLKPVNGRIDVQAVRGLTGTVNSISAALKTATSRMDSIDTSSLISEVAGGVTKLDDALTEANSMIGGVQTTVKILPGLMGADGPRNYLMLFENNTEARGWAGNPAALLMLTVDNGSISIAKQASTADFPYGLKQPIVPLDAETEALYGSKIGRYIQDTTTTPDFPYTAQLAEAFWKQKYGGQLDGVVSFDPVALSYLLKATGPITLPTGDKLTSDNAVSLLLHKVYFTYSDNKVQDAFFAAAAASVFDALQSGNPDTKQLIGSLGKAAGEHRLLFWSNDKAVQKVIATTPLLGQMPQFNKDSTAVGVFFDDTTGGKMNYYFYPSISAASSQCTASAPSLTGSVTMKSKVPKDAATSLPSYVLGPFYRNGTIAMDVALYGPVGGTMSKWTVNGKAVTPAYVGEHLGRPASKISVRLKPGQSITIGYTMKGKAGEYGPLDVLTTGLAHPTPITVSTPGCDAKKK